ncbi:MAG TPA: 16S rRNA (guanine(966)-N(2))-methyltransferase RsmD [Salinivirgaceae bacterium]|nr:16S rRNA (guanine(966)-N(2))-methyltransferase RsmD [Salinivirgaceae bacterium]
MRIIGGKLGGRRIEISKTFSSRPTTDIAREALFNILSNRIDFKTVRVLDLFSGTGSVSFEFYSRGTTQIDAVEINRKHISSIIQNINTLNISGINVLCADAFRFLSKCSPESYDIIFADPPFDLPNRAKIPDLIFQQNILKPEGFLILEHEVHDSYEKHQNWKETRHYGKVTFSFFCR